jgi:hypothetical protein
MMSYGNVVQVKTQAPQQRSLSLFAQAEGNNLVLSDGNWLAVQYESQLAAQEAVCNQPYIVPCSSSGGVAICGAVDASTNGLIQRLTSASKSMIVTTTTARPIVSDSATTMLRLMPEESTSITESDLLNLPPPGGRHNNNMTGGSTAAVAANLSICTRVLYWILGWDPEDFAKEMMMAAADDDHHHPHSD